MRNDYIWLLPPMQISVEGDALSLIDVNQSCSLTFPAKANALLELLRQLDGEQREDALRRTPLADQLLQVLERERLLVHLRQPLSEILAGRPWASRQLAYYAQLTREYPERTLEVLATTKVGIIGMGGIGAQAAQALAGAGVVSFTLTDFDTVDPSNLNRQHMYTLGDVGRRKVDVARDYLLARHPHLQIDTQSVNPFQDTTDVWDTADLFLFCGESHLTGPGAMLTTTKPLLQAGYIGPVGVLGPLRWAEQGTACPLCTMQSFGKAGFDRFYRGQVPLPATWNCSGSTINGIMGNLVAEFAVRSLAPWTGKVLARNEVVHLDMKTLTISRSVLPEVACTHRAARAA